MSLEVIYVTRHGFRSNWSVDPTTGVYMATIPSPTGIAADPELTSHGVDQAKQMGAHLATLYPPIDVVYSSPYYRCLQTISPFVELRKQELSTGPTANGEPPSHASTKIRAESGLCEWFGAAPFEHPQPASPATLKSLFPAYDEGYASLVSPEPRGETLNQLYERVAAAMAGVIEQCDAEGRRALVLCTHAAVVIALGRVLTGEVPENSDVDDFKAFTCGLSVYRRQHKSTGQRTNNDWPGTRALGGWVCEANSDCSFLSGGEERGWKFSGDESFPDTGSMSNQAVDPKL